MSCEKELRDMSCEKELRDMDREAVKQRQLAAARKLLIENGEVVVSEAVFTSLTTQQTKPYSSFILIGGGTADEATVVNIRNSFATAAKNGGVPIIAVDNVDDFRVYSINNETGEVKLLGDYVE